MPLLGDPKFALYVCWATLIFQLFVLLSPSLGGYGFIPWSFHTVFLSIGILGFSPAGILCFKILGWKEDRRVLHGVLQGIGGAFSLAGYFAAWFLHEIAGHSHWPRWGKPLSRYVHIYGGVACVGLLIFQVFLGASKLSGSAGNMFGRSLSASHALVGLRVWCALVLVMVTGLGMPFYEKAGDNVVANGVFAVLLLANAACVYLVSHAEQP